MSDYDVLRSANGKIDKDGFLWIERGEKYKQQYCPYHDLHPGLLRCGDFCPLFGEPQIRRDGRLRGWYALSICDDKILHFADLEDLRCKGGSD